MATYKTPDVYVKEISIFPPSVAEVATAIPAFIGYTEKAVKNGMEVKEPVKVDSLVEYNLIFGGQPPVNIEKVELDVNNVFIKSDVKSTLYMYDCIRMFFNNGGGKCYIISIGKYKDAIDATKKLTLGKQAFIDGLEKLKKQDEPTIILFPDAVLLDGDNLYEVQKLALAQCNTLQDRFAVFDLIESNTVNWQKGVDDFRDKIGINYLKYGAAYTPYLQTNLDKKVRYSDIAGDNKIYVAGNSTKLEKLTDDKDIIKSIETIDKALADNKKINGEDTVAGSIKQFLKNSANNAVSIKAGYAKLLLEFKAELSKPAPTAAGVRSKFRALFKYIYDVTDNLIDDWAKEGTDLTDNPPPTPPEKKRTMVIDTVRGLISASLKAPLLQLNKFNKDAKEYLGESAGTEIKEIYKDPYKWDATEWGNTFTDADITQDEKIYPAKATKDPERIANMKAAEPAVSKIFYNVEGAISEISPAAKRFVETYEDSLEDIFPLFKTIKARVGSSLTVIPPSGAVAGIYAAVDNNRGVWKAPANVSLSSVSDVTELIDNNEQEDLNVDVVAGKSINAIRPFTGKGILIWGARTLAGNDNEWRYIPVRRFFNMVEESVKKSTYWAVFEPNDANTWIKVKSMIENYLIQKWRDGALAGAKPDEAFFVKVGLGTTMTAQDILEGMMNVEIGMAVVRPAEFIILKFSHKLQES